MAKATKDQMISALYAAFYDRAPDQDGLKFWEEKAQGPDDKATFYELADGFANHPAFLAQYQGMSDEDFVKAIYENVSGYPGDEKGITHWVEALGNESRAHVVADMVYGFLNAELTQDNFPDLSADELAAAQKRQDAVTNKADVGLFYVHTLQGGTNFSPDTDLTDPVAVMNDPAWQKAQAAIDGVTDDPKSVEAAEDKILGEANTFTLTPNADHATAIHFDAPKGWTPGGDDQVNTLNDDDVLKGKGDNADLTFHFVNDADTGDTSIMPSLTNIATIDTKFDGDGWNLTLDLQDASGVKHLNMERIDNGTTATYDNIQDTIESAKISNSHANATDTLNYNFANSAVAGNADEVTLTLDNAQLGTVNFEATQNGYETIDLVSSGAANSMALFNARDLETLNISGDQDLKLGASTPVKYLVNGVTEMMDNAPGLGNVAGTLTKVDASNLTGDLTYQIGGEINAALTSNPSQQVQMEIKGGEGDDTFVLVGVAPDSAANNTDTIDGGAGDNTLEFDINGTSTNIAAAASGATLTNLQHLEVISGHDQEGYKTTFPGLGNPIVTPDATTIDADAFDALQDIYVRNEGMNDDVLNGTAIAKGVIAEPMTVTLNNLTAQEATHLTIAQGTTGNNAMNDIVSAQLKNGSGNADTMAFNLVNSVNADARFNIALNASAKSGLLEKVVIEDNDAKSNTVSINDFNSNGTIDTGTLEIKGGQAGQFMNLDSDSVISFTTAGSYGFDRMGTTSNDLKQALITAGVYDSAVSTVFGHDAAPSDALTTKTIDASDYKGDFIVRVGQADQNIKLGAGNDTVIFSDQSGTSKSTSGLTISDSVSGGAGYDTVALDGGNNAMILGASEWTNLSGIDALRLSAAVGATFNIGVTDHLVDQSDDGNMFTIINNNASLSFGANEVATTVDLRDMENAQNHITFVGPNGNGTVPTTIQTVIVDDVTANGGNILNGGDDNVKDALAPVSSGNNNVLAYHATTNTNQVTIGDLQNVKNFSTMTVDNDTTLAQTVSIQLDSAIVDQMVDSSKAASATNIETLTVTANDSPTIAAATTALNLDASAVASRFSLTITDGSGNGHIVSGNGADTITTGAGADNIEYKSVTGSSVAYKDTITDFTSGTDYVTLDLSGFSVATRTHIASLDANNDGVLDVAFDAAGTANGIWANATDLFIDNDGDGVADFDVALAGVANTDIHIA